MTWRGDQKLLGELLSEWDMCEGGSVATPSTREEGTKTGVEGDVEIKDQGRITKFRRGAAKLNYMSLDDPRIAYATKQVAQVMAKPTEEGEVRIKRIL